jgi:hypothetical protein
MIPQRALSLAAGYGIAHDLLGPAPSCGDPESNVSLFPSPHQGDGEHEISL